MSTDIAHLRKLAEDYTLHGDWTFEEREIVGNALPALLDEVDALREQNAALTAEAERMRKVAEAAKFYLAQNPELKGTWIITDALEEAGYE